MVDSYTSLLKATPRTSPFLTAKKLVELHVATKPSGSSIRASSAPALLACMWWGAGAVAGGKGVVVVVVVVRRGLAGRHERTQ